MFLNRVEEANKDKILTDTEISEQLYSKAVANNVGVSNKKETLSTP